MDRSDTDKSGGEHRLADISGFPREMIAPLASRWIETGEQLLAVAASADGKEGLSELLGVAEPELLSTLNTVRHSLGSERVATIESSAQRGGALGVRFSDDQKRRLGIADDKPEGPAA